MKLPRNKGKAETVYKFKTAELRKLAESLQGKGGEEEAGDYGVEEESPSEESSVADKFAKYDPTPADDGRISFVFLYCPVKSTLLHLGIGFESTIIY